MASIRKEIIVAARPEDVWTAVRDFGTPHERLFPGFLVDTQLESGARIVTFANDLVARELVVDIDDDARRLVWAVVGSHRLAHHKCRSPKKSASVAIGRSALGGLFLRPGAAP